MERSKLFEWVKETYGTEPDYPWNDWNAVLRHSEKPKWYALIMEVPAKKLGLNENRIIDILNVKCDPTLIGLLRSKPGYFPAYHMNKEKWLSIVLDGSVPDRNEFLSLKPDKAHRDLWYRISLPAFRLLQ